MTVTPLPLTKPLTAKQNKLVLANVHVARRVAARFRGRLPADEAQQCAMLGLTEAARSYRPDSGVPFAGYAWKRIWGEVMHALRKEAQERRRARAAVLECLSLVQDDRDLLTDTRESQRASWERHRDAAMAAYVLGLAAQASLAAAAGSESSDQLAHKQLAQLVERALSEMPAEQQELLRRFYWQGMELKQLAAELNTSYSTIRRRHSEALAELKHRLSGRGIDSAVR